MIRDELIAFLKARLDEDWESEWPHRPTCQMLRSAPPGFPFKSFSCNCDGASRWMLESEIKRAIVAAYEQREMESAQPGGETFGCHATGLLIAIRHLATAYEGRPDYRKEWRP